MHNQITPGTPPVSSLDRLDEILNDHILAAVDHAAQRAAWQRKVDVKRHLEQLRPRDVERTARLLLAGIGVADEPRAMAHVD